MGKTGETGFGFKPTVLGSIAGLFTWLVRPARSGSTLSPLGSCKEAASCSQSLPRPSDSFLPKVLTSGARGWKGESRPKGTGPGVSEMFKVMKNDDRPRRWPHFILAPSPKSAEPAAAALSLAPGWGPAPGRLGGWGRGWRVSEP